jgi:hypothetical protein
MSDLNVKIEGNAKSVDKSVEVVPTISVQVVPVISVESVPLILGA